MMERLINIRMDLRNSPYRNAVLATNGVLEWKVKGISTWREFLVNDCGIDLACEQTNENVFVCNVTYVANPRSNRSGDDKGWRANLDNKISEFVSKYKRNLSVYTVRLLKGPPRPCITAAAAQADSSVHSRAPLQVEAVYSFSESSSENDEMVEEFLTEMISNRRQKNQSHQNVSEMQSNLDVSLSDTTVTVADQALGGPQGIQNQDLKAIVRNNALRIDNDLLLETKKEIKRLRDRNTWSKIQKRAPYLSIVIDELLQSPDERD